MSYAAISTRKLAEQRAKIPSEWLLPDAYLAEHTKDPRRSVMHVPRTCGLLSEKELEITERFDAVALSEEIRERRLSVLEVTRAFCKRAAIAHQVVNCLTEIFFDQALARAESLDAHLSAGKLLPSPLFGLPISIKDSFQFTGVDATIGLATYAFQPSTQHSLIVDTLLNAGAVLYCKTNIPQTLAQMDSHNNVFGRTLNPHNAALTAGGSTGGEGALIAMRGSVLGVGTDVGGSIRAPAFVNGIYGIKPSCGRVPYAGQRDPVAPGSDRVGLAAAAGPLAGSLRDCEFFIRAVAEARTWEVDHSIVPQRWEAMEGTDQWKKLVVGVVSTDGLIEPLPPIKRLFDEVTQKLDGNRNIRVVPMDISAIFSKCQSLVNGLLGVDGGGFMADLLESHGEPLSPWLVKRFRRGTPKSLDATRELHARRVELEKKFLEIWKEQHGQKVDVLICPLAPHPVAEIDRWNGVSYTCAFNLLDYPAGTIPVRKFEERDLLGDVPDSEPLSSWDAANRELWTKVDRSVYLGSPLGIQVVAPKLQERRLCEAMKVIEDALSRSEPESKL